MKFKLPDYFYIEYMVDRCRVERRLDIKSGINHFLSKFKSDKKTASDLAINNNRPLIIKSSMDIEIERKGGILANDGSLHTTANSYKEYLKNNGLVIKDWAAGTLNKASIKGVDKEVVGKIVNKYF